MKVRIIKCSNSNAWWMKKVGHNIDIILDSKFIDSEGYISYDIVHKKLYCGDYIYAQDILFLKQIRKLKLEKIYESR